MDTDDDVERLFSWLKTPDLRYREFAGEREIADAVATWPALRQAAAETGHAEAGENAGAPSAPVVRSAAEVPEPRRAPVRPGDDEAAGGLLRGESRLAPSAATPGPAAVPRDRAQHEPRERPPPSREAIFGGTYRGFDESGQAAPEQPEPASAASEPAEGEPRSLDAVFARLARPAARYRDERRGTSSGPGLGPVFRRLR